MTPPHVTGSDTSRAAAEAIRPHAPCQRDRVLASITARHSEGMTCDEVEVALGLSHQTASARIRDLVKASVIVDSDSRRPTRTGRKAAVCERCVKSPAGTADPPGGVCNLQRDQGLGADVPHFSIKCPTTRFRGTWTQLQRRLMRLLVTGNRNWTDSDDIAFHLALIFGTDPDRLVIHGNCGDLNHRERGRRVPMGADVLAGWCAAGVGAAVDVYPVDHALDGPWPNAGPRRNERMFRESRPDRGLAFGALWKRSMGMWKKSGTGGMVSIMLGAGLPVRWVAEPGARHVDLVKMPRP